MKNPAFGGYREEYAFNTAYDPRIYTVEGADALEPAGPGAFTLARYRENNMSAAVAFRGPHRVVSMGFPFETILDQDARDKVMEMIINFLTGRGEHE